MNINDSFFVNDPHFYFIFFLGNRLSHLFWDQRTAFGASDIPILDFRH